MCVYLLPFWFVDCPTVAGQSWCRRRRTRKIVFHQCHQRSFKSKKFFQQHVEDHVAGRNTEKFPFRQSDSIRARKLRILAEKILYGWSVEWLKLLWCQLLEDQSVRWCMTFLLHYDCDINCTQSYLRFKAEQQRDANGKQAKLLINRFLVSHP